MYTKLRGVINFVKYYTEQTLQNRVSWPTARDWRHRSIALASIIKHIILVYEYMVLRAQCIFSHELTKICYYTQWHSRFKVYHVISSVCISFRVLYIWSLRAVRVAFLRTTIGRNERFVSTARNYICHLHGIVVHVIERTAQHSSRALYDLRASASCSEAIDSFWANAKTVVICVQFERSYLGDCLLT